jgi:hypothetical protein
MSGMGSPESNGKIFHATPTSFMMLREGGTEDLFTAIDPLPGFLHTASRFAEKIPRSRQHDSRGDTVQGRRSLPGNTISHAPGALENGDRIRRDEFRSRAGSRRPEVCDKVGDGEVDLMTDGADDGNRRGRDRPRNDLFIELPEILEATSSACDDDDVDYSEVRVSGRELRDGLGNLSGSSLALDSDGRDYNGESRMTAMENIQKILQGGARWRSHHADAAGKPRQRTLLFLIKKPIGFEAPL